jgi:S-adenosylmethionine-diacylglycerol 3-amino-3-carboxypropyl transferase
MVNTIKTKLLTSAQDAIFKQIHSSRLIYNACWEDPRLDRRLLKLDGSSRVVMITSAGCNALDYLLDSPTRIYAIDVNPRQNALLQLKLNLIRHREFDDLFALFGQGYHWKHKKLYAPLRPHLPTYARDFWDDNIDYFDPTAGKKSFYFYGTSGNVAWIFQQFLKANKPIRAQLYQLIEAETLAEQSEIYDRIEPKLWNKLVCWLVKHPMMMAMCGVPRPQMQLVNRKYAEGMTGYVRDSLRHLCTQVSMRDNYFWRVYLTGSYTKNCCPNYLKEEHFALLRANANKIHPHTTTLTEFLKCYPGPYSHYILLDHQDWLAWHDPEALAEEWRLILDNSQPGSKILMRSAAEELEFLPETVRSSLKFYPELTEPLHKQDRVGTYGSLHFAEVQ